MVVVNLYPFEKVTAKSPDVANALENIDIGGPTMIRAAAKNYPGVAVVTDPSDYENVLSELMNNNACLSERTRLQLMLKAFERTAAYDSAISTFFQRIAAKNGVRSEWPAPERLLLSFETIQDLRYGENPHQNAAVYRESQADSCIASASMVAGEKELSYTNLLDADAAYRLVRDLNGTTATVIIKHTNPCGVGKGKTLAESCHRALETDPVSAFGGVYAFTRQVDSETAHVLNDKFVELVVAPGFESEALKTLSVKKNRRILDISGILAADRNQPEPEKRLRSIRGGILYQDSDEQLIDDEKLKVVTKRAPNPNERDALLFAWMIVKLV